MNEVTDKPAIQTHIDTAIFLLEKLEAAIDAHNQQQIGARLYELKRSMNLIRQEVEDGPR